MKIRGLIVIAVFLAFVHGAWSAEVKYPIKPIHIWVGFTPGGSTDTLTRALSTAAEKTLGQPIAIENKPGGGGSLCFGLLKSAKPDGYTRGASTDTALTRAPHLVAVQYDADTDFNLVVRMGLSREGVAVKSDSPFKKFQDLIEFARKNPGQLTIGLPGHGTTPHLRFEKIAQIEKVKFQYIYFQGSAPTVTALLGGHVMVANCVATSITPHVRVGTLRPLLFEPEVYEEWPEVPTLEKLYGIKLPTGELIAVPKGVPKPIRDKLVSIFSEAMKSPEFIAVVRRQELILPHALVGEDLDKWLKSTYDFYGALIKEMGLQKK